MRNVNKGEHKPAGNIFSYFYGNFRPHVDHDGQGAWFPISKQQPEQFPSHLPDSDHNGL